MTFRYDEIVPWGRSFDEYCRMFDLSDRDLELSIIGCGDGPASFNARMRERGGHVVSCDPLYALSTEQIKHRIELTYDNVIEQTRKNMKDFVWDTIGAVEELGRIRMRSMLAFLDDFDRGKKEGRYVDAKLPDLPVPSSSFDLALCSHFLFLYSDNLSLEFHKKAFLEMCRVAAQARVFPLLDFNSKRSAHVAPLIEFLERTGFEVSIDKVPYEFQRGGNEMMRILA